MKFKFYTHAIINFRKIRINLNSGECDGTGLLSASPDNGTNGFNGQQ